MVSMFLRYPGGKAKALTFSYDDGCKEDKRLAEIFTKFGFKATFNFNASDSRDFNYSDEQIQEYFLSKGHEIANHGAFHRANGNVRPVLGIRDVLNCRLDLEKRCGKIIRGMAYPDSGITVMGSFTDYETIKGYLKDLDIAYSRTLGGDNDDFMLPEDFYAWMPTSHHINPKLMDWVDEFIALDVSTKVYHARRQPRLFYLWGHSYEFERDGNWNLIEKVCEKFAACDDIWQATNIEICDYVNAYNCLQYSADGSMIYNPTLLTIWFDIGGKVYSINPGETLSVNVYGD